MDQNEEQFLEEYKALCLKYKVSVDGCGCCGSPFLGGFYESDIYKRTIEEQVEVHINHLRQNA